MVQFPRLVNGAGKKLTGIIVIIGILAFDVVVYYHRGESRGNTFPICYPSGRVEYDTLLIIPDLNQESLSRPE